MLIGCKEACFGYDGKAAISGLNFCVDVGDYLCVVGENGSGKSTLIKGLLKLKSPMSGTLLAGEGLNATEIGYLPQQNATQRDFPASALEVALSGRMARRGIRPFYTRADKQAALDNLALLGVLALKNKCYRDLSGGQQQRVLLARALCATSRLLILDEPVSGLDPQVTKELYAQIERLRDMGLTIIMVSHDIRAAIQYASHILHLDSEQRFFGTTADYLKTDVGTRFAGNDGAGGAFA